MTYLAERDCLDAGGIAHDFNDIPTALPSYIEVARRSSGGPDEVARTLEAATAVVRRGASFVSQLLTFARKQQLALVSVDVNALALGLHDMLQHTLGDPVKAPQGLDALQVWQGS